MKVAVIGAGASGLMASITLAENGHDVFLFEKREKVGRKIVITGKGRCNVTNNCTEDEFLKNIPQNSRFLYSAIRAFSPIDAINFFENIGLRVKTERGNRVFPISDSALEVVDKLFFKCKDVGVKIINEEVIDILSTEDTVCGIKTDKKSYEFDKVIVATGGLSYPKTGSTGDGYKFAEKFGHTIVKPEPSLVALSASDTLCKELMGLSLKNVEITLFCDNKPIYKDFGEMLFTHFGVSGPIILSSSAHMKAKGKHKITIDLKPALSEKELDTRILKDFEKNINRDFINSLDELLPKKLIPIAVRLSGIDERAKVHSITKKQREKLCFILKNLEIYISGKMSIDEAIITRGGVLTKEINPKNMESKKINNLHFIGEVLDVDGYTGGFNLQIAWSTGYLVGISI